MTTMTDEHRVRLWTEMAREFRIQAIVKELAGDHDEAAWLRSLAVQYDEAAKTLP